jgi:hypothetical protein
MDNNEQQISNNELAVSLKALTGTVNNLAVNVNELTGTVNNLAVNLNDLTVIVNDAFQKVDEHILEMKQDIKELKTDVAGLKTDVARLQTDVTRIDATMVTKDYLDRKLADLRADFGGMIRKEDSKIDAVVDKLEEKKVIESNESTDLKIMGAFVKKASVITNE